MPGLIIRGILYLLAALFLGELFASEIELARGWRPFTEYGYVQVVHSVLLCTGSILLFLKAWRDERYRQLAISMGLFFVVLSIRENDQPLELFLPHGAWKYIALPFVIALLAHLWNQRYAIREQLLDWSRTFSYGVMLSGMFVLVFARLFGRQEIWAQLMGENYQRVIKNAAEEGAELLALGLILIAIIEFFFSRRSPQ